MIEAGLAFGIGILGSLVFINLDAKERTKNLLDCVIALCVLFAFSKISIELAVVCFVSMLVVQVFANRSEKMTKHLSAPGFGKNRIARAFSFVLGFGLFTILVKFYGSYPVEIVYSGIESNEILTLALVGLAVIVFLKKVPKWKK